jgi:predicted aminopeptidase
VPQFEALFKKQGSWQKFYDACQALAQLPRQERRAALAALH